ncbi:stalk domain-containing protein [Staphylococcus warneri]|uniref:stalk domain-containing protein n=1 Tax=Staphylococcus warneri TaxID=1292 RepID=UPI003BA251C4
MAGEYQVKVNGDALSDNAIIVDGKAHVPLRSVSNALGADIKVDGKTVEITTEQAAETPVETPTETPAEPVSNEEQTQPTDGTSSEKIMIYSESDKTFVENLLKDAESQKDKLQKSIDELSPLLNEDPKKYEVRNNTIERRKGLIADLDKKIEEYKAKITEIEESLAKYGNIQ